MAEHPEWTPGMACRVVEHDSATRKPVPGGKVHAATVTRAGATYVRAVIAVPDGRPKGVSFWAETGWTAWDGEYRWRLLPGTGDEDAATAAGGEGRR